jgi:hypothetical protein
MSTVANRRVQSHLCDANVKAMVANRCSDWLGDARGGQPVLFAMCDIAAGMPS